MKDKRTLEHKAQLLPASGIGIILKQQRKQQGYNQKHVVTETGYSQTYISQVEGGTKQPILSFIVEYCTAIGVAPKISFDNLK